MHQAGFTEAVASLGTAFTSGQAQILKRYATSIYLAYDSDGAGVTAALRNIGILRDVGMPCKIINMQPYKDPDEFIKNLGAEEFSKRIENAENSFFFEVRMSERNYDINDPDGRTRFLREVATKLVGFEDEIERENYIKAIAEKYELTYEAMKKQVVAIAARNGGEYKAIERPKSGISSKVTSEDAILTSQRILLTWLCEEPKIYDIVKKYIEVDDFTDPVYREVAGWLFNDIEAGNVDPGAYVSRFEEEEKQGTCAAIFNTKLEWVDGKEAREKALHDIVYKVRKNSLDEKSRKPDQTIQDVMKALEDKKALQQLANTAFKLDE